jgi:hypothetical protein
MRWWPLSEEEKAMEREKSKVAWEEKKKMKRSFEDLFGMLGDRSLLSISVL